MKQFAPACAAALVAFSIPALLPDTATAQAGPTGEVDPRMMAAAQREAEGYSFALACAGEALDAGSATPAKGKKKSKDKTPLPPACAATPTTNSPPNTDVTFGAGLPTPIATRLAEMARECQQVGSKADMTKAVIKADFNGDGVTDYAFWEGNAGCDGDPAMWAPTASAGLTATVYIGRKSGAVQKVWSDENVSGLVYIKHALIVTLGGVECGGRAGVTAAETITCERQIVYRAGKWQAVPVGRSSAAVALPPPVAPFPTQQELAAIDAAISCKAAPGTAFDRAELVDHSANGSSFIYKAPASAARLLPVSMVVLDRQEQQHPNLFISVAQVSTDIDTTKKLIEDNFNVTRNKKGAAVWHVQFTNEMSGTVMGAAGSPSFARYAIITSPYSEDEGSRSEFMYAEVFDKGQVVIACQEPDNATPPIIAQAMAGAGSTPVIPSALPTQAQASQPQKTAWGYGDTLTLVQPGGPCPQGAELLKGYCFAREIGYLQSHPGEKSVRVLAVTGPVGVDQFLGRNSAIGKFFVVVSRHGNGFNADRHWEGTSRVQPPQGCFIQDTLDEGYQITPNGALEAKHYACDPGISY